MDLKPTRSNVEKGVVVLLIGALGFVGGMNFQQRQYDDIAKLHLKAARELNETSAMNEAMQEVICDLYSQRIAPKLGMNEGMARICAEAKAKREVK